MKFINLFRDAQEQGLDAAQEQSLAAARFPQAVEESHLVLWKPGDPVPSVGRRLLLGVAPAWNRYDLILLDVMESQLSAGSTSDVTVQVFDADQCRTPEEVAAVVPGLKNPAGYPLLSVWSDGRHLESHCGYAARQRVFDILEFNPDEYHCAVERDNDWLRARSARLNASPR